MPQIKGINSVFFYVADVQKVRRFYEDVLGLPAPAVDTPEWVEYAPATGSHFALHAADPGRLTGVDRSKSAVKLSFEVTDLDAFVQELGRKGVAIVAAPSEIHGFKFCEIADPEGNVVRLLQWLK